MNLDAPAQIRESALTTLLNVVVAPQAAFASIRERPRWFVAFIVTGVLCTVATYLGVPALIHAISVSLPARLAADPNTASLPPESAKRALGFALAFVRYEWIATPLVVLVAALVVALVLLVVTSAARGSAGFGRLFSLAVNVSIVSFGIAALVQAAIVVARGPDSFATTNEVSEALPSLAWLWPAAPVKLQAFLGSFNPFTIWSFVLLALGTATVARVSRGVGFAAAAVVTLGTSLIVVLAAR